MLISVLEMGRLTCKGYCDVICTTIHPGVWRYTYQCGGAADGGRRLRSHRRNRAPKVVYFNVLTIKLFKWTAPLKSNYASIIIINIWAYFQNVSLKVCCKHYEIRCSFTMPSPHLLPHPTLVHYVHISSHSRLNGSTYDVTQSFKEKVKGRTMRTHPYLLCYRHQRPWRQQLRVPKARAVCQSRMSKRSSSTVKTAEQI